MFMQDRLLKFLDYNQYLRDHIDIFKEYFIRFYSKFYGEGIREEIEEKFSKCLFIGHQEPRDLERLLGEIATVKSNELIDELLKDSSLSLTKDDLFSNYEFSYSSLQPIYKCLVFYRLYQLGEDGRKNQFYQEKYFWDGLLRGGSPECGNSLVCRNRRVEQVKCRNLFFLGSEMKGLCFLYK